VVLALIVILYIHGILVIRHPDDGHRRDRNMFAKDITYD